MTIDILAIICILTAKTLKFLGGKWDYHIWSKIFFSLAIFNRSLAKSRRTAKRPTVLSSMLNNNNNKNIYFDQCSLL